MVGRHRTLEVLSGPTKAAWSGVTSSGGLIMPPSLSRPILKQPFALLISTASSCLMVPQIHWVTF